jgi:hypothetical protein
MALTHARIAINDSSPTQVTPVDDSTKMNCTIQVQNLGSEAVYLGGEGLTSTSYGISIVPGATVTIDNLSTKDEVYALSASGSSYVAVLKVGR